MARTQCAALMPDGRRCRHAAAPSGLFCPGHAACAVDPQSRPPATANGSTPFSANAMRQWLLGTLQAEILALCAADLPALDRANAIADLGELFLQALPSEDVDARVADLETRTAQVERQFERGEPR